MHTNRNVEVDLPSQAKPSRVKLRHDPRRHDFRSSLALWHWQVTRAHARRDESYLDVPSLFCFLCRQLPHSDGTITSNYHVVESRRVGHLLSTPLGDSGTDTRAIFNELQDKFASTTLENTRTHFPVLGLRFRLRRRLECVHSRQRGLRDIGVLSHEIVIVHVSRWDATVTGTYCGYICCVWRVCTISALKYLLGISTNCRQSYS